MKRIVERVRNEKLYAPQFDISLIIIEKVLLISGCMLFVCYLLICFVTDDRNLAHVFLGFCFGAWYVPVLSLIFKLCEGYSVQETGICFRYRFMKHKLLYKDIKCIIISNYNLHSKIIKIPYITVIGGEQDEILRYCINSKKRHVLSSIDIRYKLGAEIGCYYPGNIWKILKKGSSVISNYGFVWNKREMYKIFKGFGGNYYIARSIIENYRDEFDNIAKEYGISDKRIHVIDDSTNGEFLW